MELNYIELIKWIMIVITIFGAIQGSRKKARLFKMNLAYMISNSFSIVYFGVLRDYPYFTLYCVFLVISVMGIWNNRKQIFHSKSFEEYKKEKN